MTNTLTQIRRDALLTWRNGHVAAVLVIMVIIWLLIFLLPTAPPRTAGEVLLDLSDSGLLQAAVVAAGQDSGVVTTDRAEFERRMAADPGLIGVIATDTQADAAVQATTPPATTPPATTPPATTPPAVAGHPTGEGRTAGLQIEILAGEHIPTPNIALLRATIDELLRSAGGGSATPAYPVDFLEPISASVPLSLIGVPIFLVFEAGILGFLLVAVFMFQEKQEGTLRAYRTAPGGALPYLVAKTGVFVALSLVYGAGVLAAATIKGARPDWFGTLTVLGLSSAFMTLFGLGFASFFRNLSHWFFPGLAVLLLNIVPFFAYSQPAFNPGWVTAIPSYDAVFLVRDLVLNPEGAGFAGLPLLRLVVWTVAAAAFAYLAVDRRLLRE